MMLKDSIITVEKLGRASPAMIWRLSARSAPNIPRKPRKAVARRVGGRGGMGVAGVGAVARDGRAAAEAVGIHIDRDDDAGAERTRRRDRHRIDQRAVDQPAAAEMNRGKIPGSA